ncbi:pentapeptide repeat-containing protein, partial [Campylobacter coli]|nr:pentapeptide repeat-containing protein [Campylobacter coli]EIT7862048.1 pentapeptide repeat-containing protein [Campylobacter coli]EJA8790428.1 pentapeptide repeat-containing protein [Campylobacter coli]EJE3590522.1 pentapeptide repeat-containing protein [Campylobacter coli]ELM1304433.1 pentapeptide repeat-containing protein [Campylobacter coli]
NKFKCPKNLEEILSSIPQKVYVSLGKEEIKQILKLDFCCFVDNVFYIDSAPKIEPYEHNQNKTAIEEQRIIQCSYDDLLYLFKTYPLIFNHCIFDYKIDKKTPIEQIKKLSFLNCNFKKEVYLNFQECLDSFQMDNCVFEDRVTIKGKFNDNVYFNNSIFKNYADFHECEFEKTANFYGVRFNKTPNFSQAIFRGNLNAVNANLNFTFDDLQERIKQEYEDFNKNIENKKSLDKFANDFRDSFRTFKNALIKDNNLLDASNFHKYELYCKEIELKQNWDKRGENVKNTTDLEKNVSRIRDFMDFLLLGFYRKLCDHHTDFLKVFNNLILLIALYALFVFGFTWLHDDKLEDTRAILTLFGFFDKFRLYFDIISTIFVVFGCGFFVCKLDSYEKKNNVSKKQNINFIYIIGDFLNLIKSLLFASFIPCVFYVLFSLFGFFLNLGKDFGYSLLINTLFVSLYICLVYTKSLFFGRYVVLIFSYIVFIIMLIKQPNVIHPLIGKIANESDKFFNYPSLIVLNILYTILLALVLFSLQKTARKNSIVPS